MPYRAPLADYHLLLQILGFPKVTAKHFPNTTPDLADAILSEAAKLCETTLAPLNRVGDKHPARLENGITRTPPGFAEGFAAIAEGGWIGMSASPEHGGMGLPITLTTCVGEMMASACLALQLNPLMTQGQIEALEHHASAEIKAHYLPHLISGEYNGTMNLTEPQAGSNVGALRTRATPNPDGTHAITGQKIYITWGDNDFTSNTCHLVLARLPDAPKGTKGISLFLVPKILPDGQRNSLHVVSLEHKLGLHGSPTAVMQYDAATGWMIGDPHKGMAAMFTMMNNARLGVGMQGVGIAEAALQQALSYAQTRQQGGTAIINHPDVRRMLAEMRAETFAARAIGLACAVATDDPAQAPRAAFLTPIAKAYGTDTGHHVAQLGIQVHGGMGYIEDTGASQFARDVRVTSIYEGTNGIQAMDLVGRKMADHGAAAEALLSEIQTTLPQAAQTLREATHHLLTQTATDRFAGAVPYLRAFARVLGTHYHLIAAKADPSRQPLADYALTLLAEHEGLLAQARSTAASLYAITPEILNP